jgi:arylsulfatase A-like enzyme
MRHLTAVAWHVVFATTFFAHARYTCGGERPNVVLLLTDDQGYGDLACHGNPSISTPQMDALSHESVRLTNFHVDPTCAPTRAALMTGRYSHRVGVWHTIMGYDWLDTDEVTMGEVFKASGYRTGVSGKWHLGANYPFRPQDQGFDACLSERGAPGTVPCWWSNRRWDDVYLRQMALPERRSGFSTDAYFNEAMEFIKGCDGQPFFVYLATSVPHRPHNTPKSWAAPYLEKGLSAYMAYYYASIERVDWNLGRLRDFLKKNQLERNTILVFATDNGSMCEVGAYNAGMRGRKASQYDGGHRVPCFLHWPAGGLDREREVDRLCAHFDLLPTLIDLCGLDRPQRVQFDGRSLKPLLYDSSDEWAERTIVVESQRIPVPEKWRQCAVMTDRWRLVDGKQLFDMVADPSQTHDVAAQHPEEVGRLRNAYDDYWTSVSSRDHDVRRATVLADPTTETLLFSSDWVPDSGMPLWQNGQILAGLNNNGTWRLKIEREAEYLFTLRRWPQELGLPIRAAAPAYEEPEGFHLDHYYAVATPGRALPITAAKIRLGDTVQSAVVAEDAQEVTFSAALPVGPLDVRTWFLDKNGDELCGAYYLSVRWAGEGAGSED